MKERGKSKHLARRGLLRRSASLAAVLLLAALLLPAWLPAAGASPGWSEPDWLSPDTELNEYAQIAVDGAGRAHVVWEEWDSYQIYYASGTPGDWSEQQLVSTNSPYDQTAPNIAVDPEGGAHVIWEGYDEELDSYQIWYATNAGGEWSDPLRLSTQSEYNQGEREPSLRVSQIAVDTQGGVHAVWAGYDEEGYYYQIWYATNAGGEWSDPVRVSSQSYDDQDGPHMALDPQGGVHVVWEGYEEYGDEWLIWYATNAGGSGFGALANSWSQPEMISPDDDWPYYPDLAVDTAGAVHAVWHGHNEEIGYGCDVLYATNASGEWSYPELVSADLEHSGDNVPDIAVGPDGVPQVVWDNYLGVFYNARTGGTWDEPTLLSDGLDYDQYDPRIAVDAAGAANVVWYGYDDSGEYYRVWYATNATLSITSTAIGEWTGPVLVSHQEDYDSYDPMIALDRAGNPHVAWDDYDTSEDVDEIWHRADIRQRLVTATAVGQGAVDPEIQIVPVGSDAAITLAPAVGYKVGSVVDNGVPVTPVPQDLYLVQNVTVDHEVVVTFVPSARTWYLPEGCTIGMETWILVQNPGLEPAHVDLAFDTDQGEVAPPQLKNLRIPAGTRSSFPLSPYVQSYDVATRVTSGSEVICERATYGASRAAPHAAQEGSGSWATESVGLTGLSHTWYLAEGCTEGDFETWILVQNPNDFPVRVNLALDTEVGRVQKPEFQDLLMPAHTRASWDLSKYYRSYTVATQVTTEGGPVAAERSMYAPDRAWAHASVGSPAASDAWYLAEGCTVGMETWFLVQNPGPDPLKVDVKYLTEKGTVQGPREVLPPYSRRSYNAGDTVSSHDVAALITSQYGAVVAERSMYGPERAWGTCSAGTPEAFNAWFLAEGCTVGMDTWVLVANPGSAAASVSIMLITDSGPVVPPSLQGVQVPAGSRRSFRLNDYASSYGVSSAVFSDSPVVAERAMYGESGSWAHCSIGYGVEAK